MVSTLKNDGAYTFFAPTNAAFQKMGPAFFNKLMNGKTVCLKSEDCISVFAKGYACMFVCTIALSFPVLLILLIAR